VKAHVPLETARCNVQSSFRGEAPSCLENARAWIEASLSEQVAQDYVRQARADVAEAIARAERGQQAFLVDLDPDDSAHLALFERALAAVREERARRDRVAAELLSIRIRNRRWPNDDSR
jgi:hypothetical protein